MAHLQLRSTFCKITQHFTLTETMLFLNGFRTGFYLNYTGLRLPLLPKNMKSADVHSSELLAIINKEIRLGCMARPLTLLMTLLILRCQCSVSYASFDDAITTISSLSKTTLLCKMDLSSAFRLLPIHSSDFCLLCMFTCIQGKFYIDSRLPFKCSIACSTFEKFSSFLQWALA